MAFNLPDCRAEGVGVPMLVVVRCAFRVFVVDADRAVSVRIGFLDNPAVSGASGLDFVEVIRLPDETEIRISKKSEFLLGEHRTASYYLPDLASYSVVGSQTMAGERAGLMRIQLFS